MKTSTILVGMTITLLLLALPAGAADYTLDVFGNANGDDTIDMVDVTYTELIIMERVDETQLADAKYDGEVDILDVTQIELIILGRENQLTLIDMADRVVTVPMPVERVVPTSITALRDVAIVGAADKVVGVDSMIASRGKTFFCVQANPELMDLPNIGSKNEPNTEAILALKPDVVFSSLGSPGGADLMQERIGIPVVCTRYVDPSDKTYKSLRLSSKVLGKEDRAEWVISYVEDELDRIREITNEIPEEEKPKVYALVWYGIRNTLVYAPVDWAGGNNVAKEYLLSHGLESAQIHPEQVIIWNPDVIFGGFGGDFDERVAQLVEVHPGLELTKAVKEEKVYAIFGPYVCHDLIQLVAETYYMAKLLHPAKFHDLDVETEANKMFKEVYGADDMYNKVQEARGKELYRWE